MCSVCDSLSLNQQILDSGSLLSGIQKKLRWVERACAVRSILCSVRQENRREAERKTERRRRRKKEEHGPEQLVCFDRRTFLRCWTVAVLLCRTAAPYVGQPGRRKCPGIEEISEKINCALLKQKDVKLKMVLV